MNFSKDILLKQDPDTARGTVDVLFEDSIAVIKMKCGENRFNINFVQKMLNALDEVEKNEDVRALITVGDGKFYSNGLDLGWLMALQQENSEYGLQFRDEYMAKLNEKIMTFPVPTIAALNGHAFAAGALFAAMHDYMIMSSNKGWWCMNEVFLNLRLSNFTQTLMRKKLGRAFHHAMVMGQRFTGEEAKRYGFVQEVCPSSELIPTAKSLAKSLVAKTVYDRESLKRMKIHIYQDVAEAGLKDKISGVGGVFSQKASL